MSIVGELIQAELIDMECDSISVNDFFETKAEILKKLGFVEKTYLEAIIEREKEYPTGLNLENIAIAIPHTTVDHIKKPFIYFNKLVNRDIEFIQMGTDDVIVKPEYILMLGIKEPKNQVNLLAEIMELFSQKEFIYNIKNAKSATEIINLFNEF